METWALYIHLTASKPFLAGEYQNEISCLIGAENQAFWWRSIYGRNIRFECRKERRDP